MIRFLKSLQFIFRPLYWVMLGRYDKSFDEKLRELVKTCSFTPEYIFSDNRVSDVILGDEYLWVGDFPYAFFMQEKGIKTDGAIRFFRQTGIRPSRLTISELYPKLMDDLAQKKLTLY